MRIISGQFRSRKLLSPPVSVTRPTSDRARESIFSIINGLIGKIPLNYFVLDAFAGSGALGLEALSRGATHATFMENNPQAIRALRENITSLRVESLCTLLMGDATKPVKSPHPMNLVFLDPPYHKGLEVPYLTALSEQGWMDKNTLVVLETSAGQTFNASPETTLIDQRRYGAALVSFLQFP